MMTELDRQYEHRTVNHSLTFVAPNGIHTNSIESTWRAAKWLFKEMNGVSRLYTSNLKDFEPQFACPSALTKVKEQRKIAHEIASELQLNSESKGI